MRQRESNMTSNIARVRMLYRLVRSRTRPVAQEAGALHGIEALRNDPGPGGVVLTDPPDAKLDYIPRLAVQATGADIGGISLIFQSQIWLPSRIGVEASILP